MVNKNFKAALKEEVMKAVERKPKTKVKKKLESFAASSKKGRVLSTSPKKEIKDKKTTKKKPAKKD